MSRDKTPTWTLRDPQVVHLKESGWQVCLSVAEGWAVACLTPERARQLGKQLIQAADRANNPSAQD